MRPVLAAALLSLPLLAGLTSGAAAFEVPGHKCEWRNADGSYTVPFDWSGKPAGVGDGEKFRLLFIPSWTRAADSPRISTYNTAAQSSARVHDSIGHGCANRFTAVASTATVNARANTRTRPGDTDASIYWLGGAKVADNYADFWDGSWDSRQGRDMYGGVISSVFVWTGTNADGTTHPSGYLGASVNVVRGCAFQ